MLKVRASRTICRTLTGRPVMLCAMADWYRWRARRPLNWLFRAWRGDRDHCAAAADWEARQGREPDLLDDWRRWGWM